MSARVFISCGQSKKGDRPTEREVADEVRNWFEKKGYEPFVSVDHVDPNGMLNVFDILESSDYYVFIDFKRECDKLPLSLFSHQELAVARLCGFSGDEMIILREKDVPRNAITTYMPTGREEFGDRSEVENKIKECVQKKVWSPEYRRLIHVEKIIPPGGHWCLYEDDWDKNWEKIWKVKVQNKRKRLAAERVVAILDTIKSQDGKSEHSGDHGYLKWAGVKGYDLTILPEDTAELDLFSCRKHTRGIYLHSNRDVQPRKPILKTPGIHTLCYKIFVPGLPMCAFGVKLKLRRQGCLDRRFSVKLIDGRPKLP